jgi:hypothetical protein
MFFDYSVVTPVDENIDDMLNKAPSLNVQSAVGAELRLNPKFMIDNTRRTKNLRLDDQSLSTNYDAYDAGRLIIGLDQFTAAVEFGKLVVDYEIEFLIPASQKIPDAVGRSAMLDSFVVTDASWVGASGTLVALRSNWVADSANAGNVVLDASGGLGHEFFQMEEGFYLVVFNMCVPYHGGNNLLGGNVNLALDSVLSEYLYIATPLSGSTAQTLSGSAPVGVHGGGGMLWPVVAQYYTALGGAALATVRVDCILLA